MTTHDMTPRCGVGSFRLETHCPHPAAFFAVLMARRRATMAVGAAHPQHWYYDTGWHPLKVSCDDHRSMWTGDIFDPIDWQPIASLAAFMDSHVVRRWGRDEWDYSTNVLALYPEQVRAVVSAKAPHDITAYLRALGGGLLEHTAGVWRGDRYTVNVRGETMAVSPTPPDR